MFLPMYVLRLPIRCKHKFPEEFFIAPVVNQRFFSWLKLSISSLSRFISRSKTLANSIIMWQTYEEGILNAGQLSLRRHLKNKGITPERIYAIELRRDQLNEFPCFPMHRFQAPSILLPHISFAIPAFEGAS